MNFELLFIILAAALITMTLWGLYLCRRLSKATNELQAYKDYCADLQIEHLKVSNKGRDLLMQNNTLSKDLDAASVRYKGAMDKVLEEQKALEDTLCKVQARKRALERELQSRGAKKFYIQVKYNTKDSATWEYLTKDLFYTRRTFRSIREAAKEAKRQRRSPYVCATRIVIARERLTNKGDMVCQA